jgi:hypothetical protein
MRAAERRAQRPFRFRGPLGGGFFGGKSGPPFPSTVVPFLWLDGTKTAFSDVAGTVPAVAPSGRVANAKNTGTFGGAWLQNTADARCFRDATGMCFETIPTTGNLGGTGFAVPAGATLPANTVTIAGMLVNRTSPLVNSGNLKGLLIGQDNATTGQFGPFIRNGELCVYHNGTIWGSGLTVPLATPTAFCVRISPTGIDAALSIGGVVTTAATVTAIIAGTIASLSLAIFPAFGEGLDASVTQLLAVTRTITDPERTALLTWLAAQTPAEAFPVSANYVAISGDSIAEAAGLSSQYGWAYRMLPALEALGPQIKLLNLGIPSIRIDAAHIDYTNVIAPIYSASRPKNVCIVQVVTNTIAFAGLTAAQVLTQYYSLCDDAKAQGFRVLACTCLPRSDAGISATFEADRQLFNTDVRANFAAHAFGLIDFAGVAGVGAAGDSNGANYQSDHVHPSQAGMVLLTPVAQAATIAALS